MLDYTVAPLRETWPEHERTPHHNRARSPFKTIWTKVLKQLERELDMLQGREVVFRLDVTEYHIRQDGQMRADARPASPAVEIEFESRKLKSRLRYRCDRYGYWQDNVSAIARALEALRMIDRYGVNKGGEQYVGFRALPAGGKASITMDADQAAGTLARFTNTHSAASILSSPSQARAAFRAARFHTHPDRNGGDRNAFDLVDTAGKVLSGHHGVSL